LSRFLLYCVFVDRGGDDAGDEGLKGVQGAQVFVLRASGIAAAVSRASAATSAGVENLLEYSKAIRACHRKRTVIPMRFGSFFESESQLLNALESRAALYRARLKALDGCSEMGIRVMAPAARDGNEDVEGPARSKSGKAFLMGRKAFYESRESIPSKTAERIERIKETLAGAYREIRCERKFVETEPRGGVSERLVLVSLFFLVPDAMTEKFRSLCGDIDFPPPVKTLVSGPWPPFNFVSDESDFAGSSK
jgi:hypothetical protein